MINTTFDLDFAIAERFGESAVVDTFQRAFGEWKDSVEYLTALVITLNHKIWEHYEENDRLATLYNTLWATADEWCMENLSGGDMDYYLAETD